MPVVFRYKGGGKDVSLAASFLNDWKDKVGCSRRKSRSQIKLHRSGNDLYTIQMIPTKGDHHYKYYVDGEWKTDTTQPTTEESGFKNNVINLEGFVTYEMEEKQEEVREKEEIEAKYKQAKQPPSYDTFTGEPPILPPYLRQIILNKVAIQILPPL